MFFYYKHYSILVYYGMQFNRCKIMFQSYMTPLDQPNTASYKKGCVLVTGDQAVSGYLLRQSCLIIVYNSYVIYILEEDLP